MVHQNEPDGPDRPAGQDGTDGPNTQAPNTSLLALHT